MATEINSAGEAPCVVRRDQMVKWSEAELRPQSAPEYQPGEDGGKAERSQQSDPPSRPARVIVAR
jgi:hypothetical protein